MISAEVTGGQIDPAPVAAGGGIVQDFEVADLPILLVVEIDRAVASGAVGIDNRLGTCPIEINEDWVVRGPRAAGMQLARPVPARFEKNGVPRQESLAVHLGQRLPRSGLARAIAAVIAARRIQVIRKRMRLDTEHQPQTQSGTPIHGLFYIRFCWAFIVQKHNSNGQPAAWLCPGIKKHRVLTHKGHSTPRPDAAHASRILAGSLRATTAAASRTAPSYWWPENR